MDAAARHVKRSRFDLPKNVPATAVTYPPRRKEHVRVMADKPQDGESDTSIDSEAPAQAPPAPRRGPGHRAADARDTAAEMAARAHEISLEAGSRMAGAMREVIGAAAGLSEFAIESARDLIHYMIRRGQMSQDEGDSLIQMAEGAYIAKHGALPKPEPKAPPPKPIPLGQLPKAVTAPAAAAEAALGARAALRAQDPRPAGKPFVEVAPKPVTPSAPPIRPPESRAEAKPAAKTATKAAAPAKAPAKGAAPAPVKAAPPAAPAAAPAKAAKAAPAKAAAGKAAPTKAAPKAPAKAPAKAAKAPAKAPAKAAKAPAKAPAKKAAPAKAAKAPAKAPAKKAAGKRK
jgi:hypothetical protein